MRSLIAMLAAVVVALAGQASAQGPDSARGPPESTPGEGPPDQTASATTSSESVGGADVILPPPGSGCKPNC